MITLTGLNLSPFGVVNVCPSSQAALSCVSNGSLLEWTMTVRDRVIGRRLVSSEVMSDDILPLSVSQTTFSFTLESRQPFNVTLTVINATVDMNIHCQEYPSTTTNELTASVHVLKMSSIESKFNYVKVHSVMIIIISISHNNITPCHLPYSVSPHTTIDCDKAVIP